MATLPSSGMTRDGWLYALPTLERATDERDCSALPTPKAQEPGWDATKALTKDGSPAEAGERAFLDGLHRTWGLQQVIDSGAL